MTAFDHGLRDVMKDLTAKEPAMLALRGSHSNGLPG